MKRICCLVGVLLVLFGGVSAQDNAMRLSEYKALRAAQMLLAQEKYDRALRQARAAERLGKEQSDDLLQAMALRLQATVLTERPRSRTRDKLTAARLLQESSQILQSLGRDSLVDATLTQLWELADREAITTNAPVRDRILTRRKSVNDRIDSMALANETMAAIVATQENALFELTNQQYQHLLQLGEQERKLDSLSINQLQDSLLLAQQELQLSNQESELSGERARRNFFILLAAAVALIALALYSRFQTNRRYQQQLEEKNKDIETARQRSDELLLNILPAPIAEELKEKGRAPARYYESVTVLFSDFVNFSAIAQNSEPAELITYLDTAFRAFDDIMQQHGLEKIKTIGDAYMCAGGVPEPSHDHATRTVMAALAMQAWLAEHTLFEARIGIHTGPVVAGVVGSHKFAYDIWGDTVNLASRLEEAGEIGKVNVSADVCQHLRANFKCTLRGKIPVKNLGKVEMYFVEEDAAHSVRD